MNEKIDQKIKNILSDLRTANKRKQKFIASDVLSGKKIKPKDHYEMRLAFAEEERQLVELELAYGQKYPNLFTEGDVERLKSERDRLIHRIRAFKNRQWPGQFRE